MRSLNYFTLLAISVVFLTTACNSDKKEETNKEPAVIKGLYSFGPEAALFIDCKTGKEYWAADSSAQLELQYSQLAGDKHYQSVYVELEGNFRSSGTEGAESAYDSTLTVKKLITLKEDIPEGPCK